MSSFYKSATSTIEEQDKKDKDRMRGGLAVGAGAASMSSAVPKLLGYQKVHHGTKNEVAADSIRRTGIRKSYVGAEGGGSKFDMDRFGLPKEDFKGKVFTSKHKMMAKEVAEAMNKMEYKNGQYHERSGNLGKPQVITARVPYRAKKRMGKDVVMDMLSTTEGRKKLHPEMPTFSKNQEKVQNFVTGKIRDDVNVYKHSIKPRFIEGSEHYKGKSQFLNKNNFKRYFQQEGGKARFAKGVGYAGAGLAALGWGANKLYKSFKGPKTEDTK